MRRSARNQSLPQHEEELLNSLNGIELKLRCKALYEAGWTLSSIGEPLGKQRSTIRFWITNAPEIRPKTPNPIPTPEDKSYVPKKHPSPGISPTDQDLLAQLAPVARKYRSRLSPTHSASIANHELTQLSRALYEAHVPIQEIADAAGVTYRAMYRRIHQR